MISQLRVVSKAASGLSSAQQNAPIVKVGSPETLTKVGQAVNNRTEVGKSRGREGRGGGELSRSAGASSRAEGEDSREGVFSARLSRLSLTWASYVCSHIGTALYGRQFIKRAMSHCYVPGGSTITGGAWLTGPNIVRRNS